MPRRNKERRNAKAPKPTVGTRLVGPDTSGQASLPQSKGKASHLAAGAEPVRAGPTTRWQIIQARAGWLIRNNHQQEYGPYPNRTAAALRLKQLVR